LAEKVSGKNVQGIKVNRTSIIVDGEIWV
jgi:hypothetical protein